MNHHGVLKRLLPMCTILLVCLVSMPGAALGADVDVYAEGAYTDTDLVLNIYADINTSAILSFGVRVEYPNDLEFDSATKNEDVWYLGDGTEAGNYDYMDPEETEEGVVIIGGKLDTGDPEAGVPAGERVLLGTVTFSHAGVTNFDGVTLTYGRGDGTGDYKNFVSTAGEVYDGNVSFAARIVCDLSGDANRDGLVNYIDLSLVQANWLKSGSNIDDLRADINQDGLVNYVDLSLVQANWLKSCQ